MITKTGKVWLGGAGGITRPLTVSQYDTGWTFALSVYIGSALYDSAEAVAVTLEGDKPDGTAFAIPGTFSAGVATFDIPADVSAVSGTVVCELRVSVGDETVGTANFDIIVEAAPLAQHVTSEDNFAAMQALLDEVSQDAASAAQSAATAESAAGTAAQTVLDQTPAMVNAWLEDNIDPASGYALDRSLQAQNAAAPADLVGELKSAINNDRREVETVWNDGGYISTSDGSVISYNTWKYTDYIDVRDITHGYVLIERASTVANDNTYNAAYDENKNFIAQLVVPLAGGVLSLLPQTRYIRLSCNKVTTESVHDALNGDQSVLKPLKFYYYSSSVAVTEKIPFKAAKYTITVPDGYLISVVQYDENGTAGTTSDYLGSREIWRGNNCYYIALYIKKSSGGNIDTSDPAFNEIKFEEKKSFTDVAYCKVSTFNVGLWYNGVTRHPDATVKEYSERYRRFLGENNPELMAMLEAPAKINQSETVNASDLFYFKFPFMNRRADGNSGRLSAAKNSMLNPVDITFASGSGRPAFSFDYQIGNAMVKFYVVHLSIEASTEGIRQTDLAEIATWLENNDYCVVMGDFNTYDMSELSVFSDYNIANGGIFGEFITWPNVTASWPNGAIDNIITTKNISIQNVIVPNVQLSDHKPLFAELSVYY